MKAYIVDFIIKDKINASNSGYFLPMSVLQPQSQLITANSFSEAEQKANNFLNEFNEYNGVLGSVQVLDADGNLNPHLKQEGERVIWTIRTITIASNSVL